MRRWACQVLVQRPNLPHHTTQQKAGISLKCRPSVRAGPSGQCLQVLAAADSAAIRKIHHSNFFPVANILSLAAPESALPQLARQRAPGAKDRRGPIYRWLNAVACTGDNRCIPNRLAPARLQADARRLAPDISRNQPLNAGRPQDYIFPCGPPQARILSRQHPSGDFHGQ